MVARLRCSLLTLMLLCCLPVAPAVAQASPPILLFGNQPPRGMWRVELTDAVSGGPAGATAVCMDPTQNIGAAKPATAGLTCTTKTLQNTRSTAQFETSCSSGRITRVTLTRASEKVFSFTAAESGGNEAPTTIKGRYQYEGPCTATQGSGGVQVDKNSAQCQQLRAQLGSTTLESACGQIPAGSSRDACIKQMEPLFKVMKSCD